MESLNPLYEERLGKQDSCPDMFVIPTKCVICLRRPEGLTVSLNVVEISSVLGRLVQPSSSPQKLILYIIIIVVTETLKLTKMEQELDGGFTLLITYLVPREGAIEGANIFPQPITVRSSVLIRKCKHPDGPPD